MLEPRLGLGILLKDSLSGPAYPGAECCRGWSSTCGAESQSFIAAFISRLRCIYILWPLFNAQKRMAQGSMALGPDHVGIQRKVKS